MNNIAAHIMTIITTIASIIFNNLNSIIYTSYKKQPGGQLTDAMSCIDSDIPLPIDFEPFCDQLGTIWPNLDYQWSLSCYH